MASQQQNSEQYRKLVKQVADRVWQMLKDELRQEKIRSGRQRQRRK